jgi:hypothetical protein
MIARTPYQPSKIWRDVYSRYAPTAGLDLYLLSL